MQPSAESPTKKFKPNQQLTMSNDDVSMRSDDTTDFKGDLGDLMRKNTGNKSIIVMNFINNDEDMDRFKGLKLLERIGEGGEGIVYRSNIIDGKI